ncbi:hypothetical protein ALO98_200237 [Pseudomonas syringae pv. tagetis]|nr:hypothetical protein ALO98_200237 [Pseudomonas syringae pv. tagetis]
MTVLAQAAQRRFVTRSVTTGIPTLEREERSSQLSCVALRRMPLWTLRVRCWVLGTAWMMTWAQRYDGHSSSL